MDCLLATCDELYKHHSHQIFLKRMLAPWMRENSWGMVIGKYFYPCDSFYIHHHRGKFLTWWAEKFTAWDLQEDRGANHYGRNSISMIVGKDGIWDDQLHNSMGLWEMNIWTWVWCERCASRWMPCNRFVNSVISKKFKTWEITLGMPNIFYMWIHIDCNHVDRQIVHGKPHLICFG